MPYTPVQKIPLNSRGRWSPSAVPKVQGVLCTVTGKPLTWEDGRRILEQYLRPEMGVDYEQALLRIGAEVKRTLIKSLRMGGTSGVRPLTPYTLAARAKRGNSSDAFLNDTGSFLDDLEVVLAKPATRGRQGFSGVILRDSGAHVSSHSGGLGSDDGLAGAGGVAAAGGNDIGMWKLLNILCQTGLVLYADDISPEGLRRIMAFRDRFFKGAEAFAGKGVTRDAAVPTGMTDDEYFGRAGLEQRGGSWFQGDKQVPAYQLNDLREGAARARAGTQWDAGMSVGEEAVWDRVEQSRDRWRRLRGAGVGRDGEGKGPVIFIPPRPFLTEKAKEDINTTISVVAEKYFAQRAQITAFHLRAERWDPDRHSVDMRAIVS